MKISPNKSCIICGFFVENPTMSGNAGYCLYYDDKHKSGESLKIPEGTEKDLAKDCEHYFRRVPTLTQGDFIQWRLNTEMVAGQRHIKKLLNMIAILGFLLSLVGFGLQLYQQKTPIQAQNSHATERGKI
jgi:hypothetical protein